MAINIVLHEPEIPHNTGAIARTCVLTNSRLHLIKPFGFDLSDKYLKRAGLDYWKYLDLTIYENLDDFFEKNKDANFYLATTKTKNIYSDVKFKDGDYIFFGKETAGLPEDLINKYSDRAIRIPMIKDLKRSLNLANSCTVVLYEALRQLDFMELI
ncbi:MAG: tRNA (cytidine(34)-2'-O)-methyltransferase [Eubacteriales bacterium]|uniref:tRNA (cytidine(34)-2'-O)-methyltransferase n=1 Tax=Fenollaria sp. TaxID=1965292 RepID=UPI002A7478F1|nr:tRNA (cytidine(34)-2'-O)-methyltransferase [Fenollaria sp.]MDD7339291.1 tRNA (cytidine(34)-2'-O)-methyltransferase [Eubacteriales bacterium]MDY3106287.1 tRNA (cytidine(34)-2'-O)-methyltransferase [Fenollaria sp.]